MIKNSYGANKNHPKKSGWRGGQITKKNQGRRKNIFFGLIILSVLILVFLFMKLVGLMSDRVWDGNHKINILIYNNEFSLVSYSPEEKSLTLINIPPNLYVDVPGGYGKFQLLAVPRLADFENKKDLVLRTIQNNLMIPIDGYIMVDRDKSLPGLGDESISSVFLSTIKSNSTDLKLWDLLRLGWATKGIGESRLNKVLLTDKNVLTEIILTDKAKVYDISSDKYDLFIQKYLFDPEIRKERLSIEVLNGSEYLNLAQNFSRLLTNIGGVVISVGNTDYFNDTCLITGSKTNLETYTTRKIVKVFGCQVKANGQVLKSDIRVIVGKQFGD